MLDEPIDSVITDSIVPVQDSAERLASLLKEAASWQPMLPFDTLTNQVELVEGIPLGGEKMNIEFISSILIYTVIYLVFIALLRLRGRGFLTTVYTYFFNRKRGAGLQSEGGMPNYFFVFLSVCLSFSILSILLAFFMDPPFAFFHALIYFLILFGYYFLVLGLVRLFGWTFNGRHCASEIILNLRVSAIVLGLSISPFVLALFYVQALAIDMLLYVIFGIGIIILIFRFIRLIKILYGYRVSILYMILYLCGLEILPILVLYKLLE